MVPGAAGLRPAKRRPERRPPRRAVVSQPAPGQREPARARREAGTDGLLCGPRPIDRSTLAARSYSTVSAPAKKSSGPPAPPQSGRRNLVGVLVPSGPRRITIEPVASQREQSLCTSSFPTSGVADPQSPRGGRSSIMTHDPDRYRVNSGRWRGQDRRQPRRSAPGGARQRGAAIRRGSLPYRTIALAACRPCPRGRVPGRVRRIAARRWPVYFGKPGRPPAARPILATQARFGAASGLRRSRSPHRQPVPVAAPAAVAAGGAAVRPMNGAVGLAAGATRSSWFARGRPPGRLAPVAPGGVPRLGAPHGRATGPGRPTAGAAPLILIRLAS